MALRIKSLKLNSFKSYDNVTISFDEKFNVIVGDNNIGKTTIFEAMLLWKKCYDLNIQKNNTEFYKSSNNIYMNFEELHFMRLSQDRDIFNGKKTNCQISIELFESESRTSFDLGFKLSKPSNIPNSYIRSTMINENEFNSFQQFYKDKAKLNDIIFIHQTKPVSTVLSKEPYMYEGQVRKKIEKGKSNEVLRNKIIQSITNNEQRLVNYMKNVLEIDFSFELPKKNRRNQDEYIDLKVENGGEKLDVFLQGSGFLQVAEIFSTVDILENALNILLIDEPDSHISARIQDKLLMELKSIDNTQLFVISHNDNFVSNLDAKEVIFINSDNKATGTISYLPEVEFDKIHYSMGGIVSSLTQLQKSKKVILLEGKDDIEYIKSIYKRIVDLGLIDEIVNDNNYYSLKDIAFWYMRGKDYLSVKINNYKNMIAQLVTGKKYSVLFDKDFCTNSENNKYIAKLEQKRIKCYTHNGYCFESVLFSDDGILIRFLTKVSGLEENIVQQIVEQYKKSIITDMGMVSSTKYADMKAKFSSQKKDSRPELSNVDFDDFARECTDGYQYSMNKDNIKEFIIKFEEDTRYKLFERDDDSSETYASKLLNLYIETFGCSDDIYESYKNLIRFILKK